MIFTQIEELENKGYVARVPKEEENQSDSWYLPLHHVTHRRKPGKVRIVHDSAAKTDGVCLNELLLSGPDLVNNLVNVILRSRLHPIVVSGDVKDFYMRGFSHS